MAKGQILPAGAAIRRRLIVGVAVAAAFGTAGGTALGGSIVLSPVNLSDLSDGGSQTPDSIPSDKQLAEWQATTKATRALAMDFLHILFVERNVHRAYDEFAMQDFIQHNPRIADGLAGHRAYFVELEKSAGDSFKWANVNNMILVDGDLFALHHHVFTSPDDPGRAFVDIWRVENGKIVEHWDVIEPIPAVMAHKNGVGCGKGDNYASALTLRDTISAPACGFSRSSASRYDSLKILAGYSKALLAGDVAAAIERFFTEDYRQHSPLIADGKQGALTFLREEFGKGNSTMPRTGPIRVIADGGFVMMHRLTTYPDNSRTVNIDIFRTRDGQISEHWDLKQGVPQTAANANGMW